MKNEDRIVEVLEEMVYKQDQTIDGFKLMNLEIKGVKSEVKNLQKEQQITNLSFKELRTSVIRLVDEIIIIHDHEKRIGELEKKVLR